MLFTFMDRKFNILGIASTKLPKAIRIFDDSELDDVDAGGAVLTGYLPLTKGKIRETTSMCLRGNFILFRNEDGEDRFFTIMRTEKDRKRGEIFFYAEDAGLDLLNETVGPYEADKAYAIDHYINKFTYDSGFEIGINEASTLSRKLKWEGTDTATKRVLSVATQFDNCEIKYRFETKGKRVVKKYIDIVKRRGQDLNVKLRYGKEIDNIVTIESLENLATALRPTGATPEGAEEPINLKGFIRDDGRFYSKGDGLVRDRESILLWSRYLTNDQAPDAGHIVRDFTWETENEATLYSHAVTELEKRSEVEVNFEVDILELPPYVQVGDRVLIVDEEDELYLSTRILSLERSRSSGTFKAVLGEFLIKESQINPEIQALADKIAQIKDGSTDFLWIRYADDEEGNGFSAVPANKKYMAVKHVLNSPIPSDDPSEYIGLWNLIQGNPGIDGADKFTWVRYADTVSGGGISTNPDGKKYIGFAFNKETNNATNVPTDYQWFLAQGPEGKDGEDGKDGTDGENGKTTYFYTAWADSIDGSIGLTINPSQADAKGYLGTYSSQSPTQSTSPASYAWVKLAGAFEETINQLQAEITAVPKVVVQADEPTPEPNMQWWQTESDTSNDIKGYFKWDGNEWQPQTIQQSLLNIVELNAVNINGSVISGSSFLNYWSKPASGREGIMRIEHGILSSDYTVANGNIGSMLLDENQLRFDMKDSTGKVLYGMQVSPQTIAITDASQPYGTVQLRYADLMTIPETNITASILGSGMSIYGTSDSSQPRYIRQGRLVQLTGALMPTAAISGGGGSKVIATLPKGLRPIQRTSVNNFGSGRNTFRIIIEKDGRMLLSHYGIGADMATIPQGAWIDISAVFSAAD